MSACWATCTACGACPVAPTKTWNGALLAIRHARTSGLPFLGTCGGFQHAVVEYARHVLGWADAEHAETAPEAARPVITLLSCALVEASETVRLVAGSRIARAYGSGQAHEGYHRSYGLNPAFREALLNGPLVATAFDAAGEVRAIEHTDHPFSWQRCSSPSAPGCAARCRRWCWRSRAPPSPRHADRRS